MCSEIVTTIEISAAPDALEVVQNLFVLYAHDMSEYRRSGLGRRVANALFDRFAGDWEVRELPSNTTAQAFWCRVIADYTREAFTEGQEFFAAHGREFVVQRFRGGQSRSACHFGVNRTPYVNK
jgi:predicted acetyltransferase